MAEESREALTAAPFGGSIRWRASLLTSGLVAIVLTAFSWYAYYQAADGLVRGGSERAETTAKLLATQTSQSSQQGVTRFTDLAKDPAIRRYLSDPTPQAKAQALALLEKFVLPNQEGRVEIWDGSGQRVLLTASTRSAPTGGPPTALGPGPLEAREGRLVTRTVAEVLEETGAARGPRVGYLVLSRTIRLTTTATMLNSLVGSGATVLIGNQSGSVWTDLVHIVPPPFVGSATQGRQVFRDATGRQLIGAIEVIPSTQWVLLVELPRDVLIAPAVDLLRHLVMVGLGFLVLTTVLAAALSGQVIRPLADLRAAAETIAGGDYSRRVAVNGRDEVGQLAEAFNLMAGRVNQARQHLEARAAQLSESRESADRASRTKDQFLAVLSHELRTPLNAMLGWCRMLRDGSVPTARVGHALEVVERNALAQLRLVEDLLDVSRIVAGKFAVSLEPIDPATVVYAAVESIHPVAAARHIDLATDIATNVGVVQGDPGRLQQAVWNLLSNAIKFTPAGGRVEVGVSRLGGQVEIVVRDNGEGISEDTLPHIFERLQRDDEPPAGRHAGLGLGLAIVRQVIELHGGTVRAESAGPGLGATFRVVIPAAKSSVVVPDRRAPRTVGGTVQDLMAASIRGLRVLVVEDADDARELLTDFLTGRRATVTAVDSAEAALHWLSRNRADVIISDIEMPGEDGLDLMRQIRSTPPVAGFVPAIALTAYGAPEDRDRSYAAGFQAHLVKPVELSDLVETIADLARAAGTAHPSPLAPTAGERVGSAGAPTTLH